MKPRESFPEKIKAMMARTGLSYHDCCTRLGRSGGLASAAKKRRIAQERAKQSALKIL